MKKQKEQLMDLLTEAEQLELRHLEFRDFAEAFYTEGNQILTIESLIDEFKEATGKTISS